MPLLALPLILAAATATATPAPSTGTGHLGTLSRGLYRCETPGDAGGPAGNPREDEDFVVISSSRYRVSSGRGVYLRKGNLVTFTSGPFEGVQYRLETERYLIKLGNAENLRCYWRGRLFN
jgi:hypothetical protein